MYHAALLSSRQAAISALDLVFSVCFMPFPVHMEASQLAFDATHTQLDARVCERVIAWVSRSTILAEQNYMANEHERLALILALQ